MTVPIVWWPEITAEYAVAVTPSVTMGAGVRVPALAPLVFTPSIAMVGGGRAPATFSVDTSLTIGMDVPRPAAATFAANVTPQIGMTVAERYTATANFGVTPGIGLTAATRQAQSFAVAVTPAITTTGVNPPIQFISGAQAAAASIASMPTHQTGDLLVAFAYNTSAITIPTLGAGFNNINSTAGTASAARMGYKVAASSSETSGTWTNATHMIMLVYRNAAQVGTNAINTGAGSTLTYPALTSLTNNDTTSWVVRFGAHKTATNMDANVPAGFTHRAGIGTGAKGMDTNGPVSSNPAAGTQTVNGSNAWITMSVEVQAHT